MGFIANTFHLCWFRDGFYLKLHKQSKNACTNLTKFIYKEYPNKQIIKINNIKLVFMTDYFAYSKRQIIIFKVGLPTKNNLYMSNGTGVLF